MNVFGVGPTEIIVVLIIILVLFGPERLPEMAKKIGGASREIRDNLKTVNDQMNSALDLSMEMDKARMIPPVETTTVTGQSQTPAIAENVASNTEADLPAPRAPLHDDSDGTIMPPPPDTSMNHG